MSLSAVVITKDEEQNILECLRTLSFCDEIIVVDSGSRDATVDIARRHGANVFLNVFKDFASQKNFAISKASGDWVLLIDADERVSPALAKEIQEVLKDPQVDGFFLLRKNRIFNRWMSYGSNRNDYQLRLVRKNRAAFRGIVHERIYLEGKTARLKHFLLHHSTETLSICMRKLNSYTSLEAETLCERSSAASWARMKYRPLPVFLYRAFWQRAIFDGTEGLMYSAINAYYEFVRHAKSWELAQSNEKKK